ncbi:flavodoxin domain-containing protein [Methanobacterium sp. BAmetb5]|jgi:flavodoxin|uniref:flavodoxin family protein n=1 Tax=Methanobacterium sp. BAmetb5 TaxID=2025351 RepID=UPI000E8C4231|nr:flavodoxin domain-containing protein [Methanobacterium sp. BAmetb5]AXV40298.1 MAG: flavodoxin [Methanobacterium sp. BAmetb5]
MKIGIVVYSETGHTYSVAEKLQEKLQANGHLVDIERVTTGGDVNPGSKNVTFQNQPDVQSYDALVFGSPVHAFNLAPAMAAYLEQIQSLQDKKIACFVTKGLPFNWTGGNKAISKMKKICQSKGGTVVGTDIIIWRDNVDEKIEELIRRFSVLF